MRGDGGNAGDRTDDEEGEGVGPAVAVAGLGQGLFAIDLQQNKMMLLPARYFDLCLSSGGTVFEIPRKGSK